MDFSNIGGQFKDPEIVNDQFANEEIDSNKTKAILISLLGIWGIIIYLIVGKESSYLSHWANQGLALTLLMIIGVATTAIYVGAVINLFFLICWIFTLIHVTKNEAVYVPIVGKMFNVFK